jgi:hypothetical protein
MRLFDEYPVSTVAVLAALFHTSSCTSADDPKPNAKAYTTSTADYSSPIKTYRTYLEAVKRDDQVTAKTCYSVKKPEDSLGRDMMVELWIAHHRFQKVVGAKFGKQEHCPYWRTDCTDEAIDRTISRLATSTFKIRGDTAELRIDWATNYESVFDYTGDEPMKFLKVDGYWKIPCEGDGNADQIAGPGTWGWCFREGAKLLNKVSNEIDSGKITTWSRANKALEEGDRKLEEQYGKDHTDPMSLEQSTKE